MGRSVDVDLEVFSLIWSERRDNEADENAIIKRALKELRSLRGFLEVKTSCERSEKFLLVASQGGDASFKSNHKRSDNMSTMDGMGKIRWVDDVHNALSMLQGEAALSEIYRVVEDIRTKAGRTIPKSLEATIRRTLEDHSSDSENYRGEDLFSMPKGKGVGIWGLRKRKK